MTGLFLLIFDFILYLNQLLINFLQDLLLILGLSCQILPELLSTILLVLRFSDMGSEPAVLGLELFILPIEILVEPKLFGTVLSQASEFSLAVTEDLVEVDILLLKFSVLFLVI